MTGRLCIFGEVLFDHFPDGRRVLGGAPFNVAWHLQAFGQAPYFISRVGDDAEGGAIRAAMRQWGMDTGGLQLDTQHPTGRVAIQLQNGEPAYDIVAPCAYDKIEAIPAPVACGLLYHGSLALRDDTSRQSAAQLQANRPATVFLDVNLRPPWWRREQVLEMVQQADWVKLNGEELSLLDPEGAGAASFLAEYRLQGLVLTHGARGAELLTADGERLSVRPEAQGEVVDTVGAGDAFASVMILGLANNWPLWLTLQRGQAFASAMVGQRGATVADPNFYRPFLDDWKINK
jgi:fructokinase